MAEAKPEQILNTFVYCTICREPYDEELHSAKYLPCLHSFCKSCLQSCIFEYVECIKSPDKGDDCQISRKIEHIKCPECQLEVCVEDKGVDSLPDNFIISSEERNLRDLLITELCGSCDNKDRHVTSICNDCGYLCQTCVESHTKLRPLRNHTLSSIQKKNPNQMSKHKLQRKHFCKKHPNQELTGFCYECRLLVCITCNTEDHAYHEVKRLDSAVTEISTEIQGASKQLSYIKDDFLLKSEFVSVTQKTAKSKFEQKERDMQMEKRKLIESIEMQYNKAYTVLKNMYEEEAIRLPDIAKLDAIAGQMSTANEFAHRACSTNENIQLLASSQQVKNRLYELQKCKLPDVPVDFKSDVIFTAKHDAAVKRIRESVQEVFDVNWLVDDQDQIRKDKLEKEEKYQKINPHYCVFENFVLEKIVKQCTCYIYSTYAKCECPNRLSGTLRVLNENGFYLTNAPACNVEIVSPYRILQTGKTTRYGISEVDCTIEKDCLPMVRINGFEAIKVTKLILDARPALDRLASTSKQVKKRDRKK